MDKGRCCSGKTIQLLENREYFCPGPGSRPVARANTKIARMCQFECCRCLSVLCFNWCTHSFVPLPGKHLKVALRSPLAQPKWKNVCHEPHNCVRKDVTDNLALYYALFRSSIISWYKIHIFVLVFISPIILLVPREKCWTKWIQEQNHKLRECRSRTMGW